MKATLLSRLLAFIKPKDSTTNVQESACSSGRPMSSIWKICFALTMAVVSCQALGGTCAVTNMAINHPVTPNTVIISSSLPVGSKLPVTVASAQGGQFSCSGTLTLSPSGFFSVSTPLSLASGFTDVWATGYPGIGVRIKLAKGGTLSAQNSAEYSYVLPGGTQSSQYLYYPVASIDGMELIKTGPISTGTFQRIQVLTDFGREIYYLPDATSGYVYLAHARSAFDTQWINAFNIVASNPTCELSLGDKNRTIRLPDYPLANVPASNQPFGYESFTLTANCSDATTVSFKFNGTPNAIGGDNTRFQNTGTAGGLSLHLESASDGKIIPAGGTDSDRTRTVNVSNDTAVLDLRAAYFREAPVTAGTLVGLVTVDLSYN